MNSANGISMVQKTIDVLSYLANNPKGAKLSRIAADLNYPKTTVYDILKTLLDNNFIQYSNPEKKIYIIGARVYTMGISYLDSSNLLRIAKPYLVLLADKYEKTTFIAKRSQNRAFCIYKYASVHADASTGTIGDQKLLHSTSIGKCYLAFDPDAAPLIDTIELPSFTPFTITSREALRANIEEIRRLGFSWEQRESHELMACLAAPLFYKKSMVATISMTGLYNENEDFNAQGSEIAQLANIISQQLDESDPFMVD
ncbi:MAG: IclR family transcriptional regulator [Treponema sp.]|nr:IclR family transcriptional regulator [Treponema sp.]